MRRRRHSSPARYWWYAWHRQARIAKREIAKTVYDTLMFGVGVYEISDAHPDLIRHIEFSNVQDLTNFSPSNIEGLRLLGLVT